MLLLTPPSQPPPTNFLLKGQGKGYQMVGELYFQGNAIQVVWDLLKTHLVVGGRISKLFNTLTGLYSYANLTLLK